MKKEKGDLAKLKKRLFIVAGYLLVATAMLVYVSYSHFRMKIEAQVYMPETYAIQASMSLDPKLSAAQSVDLDAAFLNDLNPSSDAADFDSRKCITIVVSNGDTTSPEAISSLSELDAKYTISIESSGRLPLEFLICDSLEPGQEKTTYTAVAFDGSYSYGDGPLEFRFKDENGAEYRPVLPKGIEGASAQNTHKIYVGWDQSARLKSDYAPSVYENMDFRKEIDEIRVKIELISDDIGGQNDPGSDIIVYKGSGLEE